MVDGVLSVRASRFGRCAAFFGTAACGAFAVAACSTSPSTKSSDASNSTVSDRRSTTTTISPTAVAVLRAYRAEWAAYDQALATANAYDTSLTSTMINPLLQQVRATLLGDQAAQIVGRGGVQLHPKVSSITATTATVVDCVYSKSELVYAKTGKPVPPVTPPEHDGVQATLVLTAGTWKVSQQSVKEGTCSAGS